MNDVFSSMDATAIVPVVKSRKRKPILEAEYGSRSPAKTNVFAESHGSRNSHRSNDSEDLSSDGPLDNGAMSAASSDDEQFSSPKKRQRTDAPNIRSTIAGIQHMGVKSQSDSENAGSEFDDIDMDDWENDIEEVSQPKEEEKTIDVHVQKPTNVSKVDECKPKIESTPTWLSVYDSLTVSRDDTFGSLSSNPSSSSSASNLSILENDGSFRFFWLDYLEHEGKLFFTGKTQDKKSKAWVSCCVTVENLERNLFVLPRERRLDLDEETDELYETDDVPSSSDVYADFDRIRQKAGISSFKGKFVKRSYAFGEGDVARGETQWLKVVYGFNGMYIVECGVCPHYSSSCLEPQIQNDVSSPNFSRIFGTNTSAFELLVLKRKIMGPCWLSIKHPQVEYKGVST